MLEFSWWNIPGEQPDGAGGQHQANGRGPCSMLTSISIAHRGKVVGSSDALLLVLLEALELLVTFREDADGQIHCAWC